MRSISGWKQPLSGYVYLLKKTEEHRLVFSNHISGAGGEGKRKKKEKETRFPGAYHGKLELVDAME